MSFWIAFNLVQFEFLKNLDFKKIHAADFDTPRVSKNDFLGNAKIMPLLTRGFSFFASFRCLPQLDCSRIKECSNYEEIIYFTADERQDR